ncbi:DUF4326 domain-containing protein [Mycobacterium malmoense]|uniref:DUF4326 domain-containing protein n=1 Tax=Mycobacterium malmoense TaxID=1780 RepID=UPI0009F2B62D|nr:DUF4326 domain-containing protein [Mycobacterium malmoense]
MPERIQRRREKGWRMPEGAVYVGRPTKWGNPWMIDKSSGLVVGPGRFYSHDPAASRSLAVALYKDWLRLGNQSLALSGTRDYAITRRIVLDSLIELRGRDLACWCPLDQPCHADVLLELANGGNA